MDNINEIGLNVNINQIRDELINSSLWGEYIFRTSKGSPHDQTTDIWVRYKNPKECIKTDDWSSFTKKHDSEWLNEIIDVKAICEEIITHVGGERLGGVLLTKLPAGCEIKPHIDSGWHADYYDKYLVPIQCGDNSLFCYDKEDKKTVEGVVYGFRNDVIHWVKNNTDKDRIVMVVCIKQNKFSKGGLCLGDTQ